MGLQAFIEKCMESKGNQGIKFELSARRRSFFNAPSGWVGVKLARASNPRRIPFCRVRKNLTQSGRCAG
jgi:hypothetical protein